jgi:hypothetical protein
MFNSKVINLQQLNHMKKFLLFSISLLLLVNGFAEKPAKKSKKVKSISWVEPTKPKVIYGIWNWIETDCCGLRRGISNPQSTADNIEIHTKKNTLPRSGTILLFKENNGDMVQFNDERPAQYFISANSDTLTLSWKHLELQTEKYVKVK